MERRHSTTSDSSDSSHTRQSSGDNIESLVGRVSKVTAPKPPANALQFVKTRPCELYRSAQEQLKKVEELKKAKKLVPDEAEEWQSNLDNWKCSRRKRQEHIIERVVEVKKLELEEHERNRRRSKTFNEMLQERNSRGRKTSLPVYQDDSNDLSYLGIGNGDRSISHDSCSTTTDSDHERDISFDQNSEKRFEGDNAIVQNGQNEKTEANDAGNNSEDVEEYTYERAIQSYVNFTESRVKGRAARSSSVEQKNFINGQTKECPPIPLKPRRSSNPRIGNSISQIEQRKHSASTADLSETLKKQPDVPKVDISKRKELFEKSTDADEMGKKMNRATEFSSSKSIKERLSSLKEYTGVNKVQSTNRLPTEISVKDRLSDIEKMKEKEDINQLKRRSSEQLSTQSIKERLSNLEKVKNSSLKLQQQNTVEPTITLKERLSSLQSACTKDPNVMLPNTEQHLNEKPILNERPQGQVEECYQMNQTDKYERAFSPDDLYSNKAQQHYRHRSLDSLDIDNDGASNDTFGRVQSLEDLDYCRNYPASSLSGDTDREDSGIHTADVSSCVSQADDYDLHMDSNSDDIKLHHQPTILEENKVAQYENSLTSQDSSCAFSFSESNDSRNVSPQAFGSSLDNAEEHGVLDEFSNSNKVSLKHGSPLPQSLPIILENSEAFPNPLNLVDGLSDSKKRLCADYSSSQNIGMDGDVINHDEVFSKKNKSVCNVEKPSSNFTSGHAPLPQGGTNISDCSIVNLSHVESNEQRIEDVEMGKRKMDSSNTVSSSSSKNPADEPNMYNSQQKPDRKTNEYGDKDNGTITEVIQNIYSVDGVELDDNVQPIDLKDPKSLNENNDHIESFKTQMDTTNVKVLSTHDKFGNYSFEPRHNHSEPDVFMPTQSFQGGLFLNLNIDQEVESVFQLSPAALEPPKEKPPPPPTDFSDDEVDITSSKKPSSLRRLDSTKRIKKEIRQKRSSFLGIEGNMDDNYMDPELELIRPPDMTTLLAEERRMERQLYRQSVCSESDSNQESRDSGVELDNKSQDIACWNHSRNDSEVYCNQSTTSEEDEIMRKEREIIETLEQEERIRKQDLGEKLALRLRQLEVEKGRGDWDRANPNDFRNKSEKLNQDSNNIQDIDEFKINGNEPNHLESLNSNEISKDQDTTLAKQDSLELYNHEESLISQESIELPCEGNTQLAWYDTRSSLQDICYKTQPENSFQHPHNTEYTLEFSRNSMQDLSHSVNCFQNGRHPVSHGRSMPNLQDVSSPRRPPPPPPPQLPAKSHLQSNGVADIPSCPQQMSRQTLHALSATPRSRLISNDTWQAKRKPRQENYNYQHWLIQEAEHRRITEQQQRQQNILATQPPQRISPTKPSSWGHQPMGGQAVNQPQYAIPPHHISHSHHTPLRPTAPYSTQHQWNHQQQKDSKPLPDSVIQTITQRIQNRMNNSDTNNNRRRYETHYSQNDHNQEKMLSVSGKKRCSHCGEELGRGAAMIIESLRLFYHIDCFKCCVCCIQLGDGMMGTDVRVRNNKLHCHNCYSSDDGVKFSCV